MQIKRKISVLAVSLIGVAGLGTGVALAQTPTSPKGPAVTSQVKEAPGQETSAATENAPEKAEPGEANLPGGGHADPAGQNVDHQFDGVE